MKGKPIRIFAQEQPKGHIPEGRQCHWKNRQWQQAGNFQTVEGAQHREKAGRGQHLGSGIQAVERGLLQRDAIHLTEIQQGRCEGGHRVSPGPG